MDVLCNVVACPELSAPWGISFPAQTDRAVFYVLSQGRCYLEVEGGPVTLVGGDLAMIPHGAAHSLRDRPETPPFLSSSS